MPHDATTSTEDGLALLTALQVADLLKISREQVYRLAKQKILPSIEVGEQTRRFLRADVEAFITARRAA